MGGKPGADFEDGPVVGALERIVKVAREHDVVAGLHNNSSKYAKRMIDMGYQFVTVETDIRLLSGAARRITQEVKGVQQDVPTAPY